MDQQDLLKTICGEAASACADMGMPLSRIVCLTEPDGRIRCIFLFDTVEGYAEIMRAPEKKDRMIAAFIRSMTAHCYDTGDHPVLSFDFRIE